MNLKIIKLPPFCCPGCFCYWQIPLTNEDIRTIVQRRKYSFWFSHQCILLLEAHSNGGVGGFLCFKINQRWGTTACLCQTHWYSSGMRHKGNVTSQHLRQNCSGQFHPLCFSATVHIHILVEQTGIFKATRQKYTFKNSRFWLKCWSYSPNEYKKPFYVGCDTPALWQKVSILNIWKVWFLL